MMLQWHSAYCCILKKNESHDMNLSAAAHVNWDVIVIGGGNAALVSAMSAHDSGATVLIIERSDEQFRGGNSRHTRNIRCVHNQADLFNTGAYTFDELWKDLCGVGTGPSNEALAELTVRESESVPQWMEDHGALFQPPLRGTLHLGRTNRFFLGGGKALINRYYRRIDNLGIPVVYEATVERFEFEGARCTGLFVSGESGGHWLRSTSVVAASGGFEANIEWLTKYWGEATKNYHIRGPKTNDGLVLRQLLDAGANVAGEERGFHSVAVDARSPKFDGGIATRIDSIPFGVVLNSDGQRFYDEGEDIWPKRYAIWGKNIALQKDQIGYIFWDSKVVEHFLPPMYGSYQADTLDELAVLVGLEPAIVTKTIEEFNAGTAEDASERFDPSELDAVGTVGVEPIKSNWAQALDTPPFYSIPARPGITFTYMGVEVDEQARIRRVDGSGFENVFAAGEIMSGNVLSSGYLAGFGMTIGTVWGRIAGRAAAIHAQG
jgi:tricarballylate dehydrogenase